MRTSLSPYLAILGSRESQWAHTLQGLCRARWYLKERNTDFAQTSLETSNYSGAARRHQLQHKETSKAPLQCGMCREWEGRQPHGVWPAHVLRCYANVEGNFRAFPTLTWEDQRLVLNSLLLPWFKASSDSKTHLEMITFMIKYLHRAVIMLPFLHKAKLLYFHLRPQFLFIVSTSFKDRDSKLEYPWSNLCWEWIQATNATIARCNTHFAACTWVSFEKIFVWQSTS